nr:glycoside hydrolase family 99-like domain-containing protein [Luteibacter rhizovicinus]
MPLNDRLRSLVFQSLRFGFRLAPMPTATRDRLRQRFLARHADLVPQGPLGQSAAGLSIRPYDHSAHRALGYIPRLSAPLPDPLPATVVAFYLPQFHPIPENDRWWGPGFTEWRNVTRALPQFEGHLQPKLPTDLGYYDLRLPQIMREQMTLAREYGVGAFCTYFYWFAGKTLLEAPLRQWLEDPTLDLPICLCWANENWSRRWDGREDDLLISQKHSAEDDLAFIAYVAPYLRDPRYLRVDGRPMLLVYRPGLLPDPQATASRWRTWCRENGVGEIHLAYVQSFDNVDPSDIGFDAAVAFPPNNTSLSPITATKRLINPAFSGQVLDWRELARASIAAPDPSYRLYPGVNPGWDNEARRAGRGRSFVHATPHGFSTWTREAIAIARRRAPTAPLVFVNAWNEWAEGAVLEPDTTFGYAWLEAIRRALIPAATPTGRPCVVVHLDDTDGLENIVAAIRTTGVPFRTLLTVPGGTREAIERVLSRLSFAAELLDASGPGRDILPFLQAATLLRDQGEALVLKLDPADARDALAQRTVHAMLNTFASNRDIGVAVAASGLRSAPGAAEPGSATLAYLSSVAGIGLPAADAPVVEGSFWCRLSALAPLLDAPLTVAEFGQAPTGSGDAMAQAIERSIAAAASHMGFRTVQASSGPA